MRSEFWISPRVYGVLLSDSCVSSESEVRGTLPGLMVEASSMGMRVSPGAGAGSCSVVGGESLSVAGVWSAPVKGMGLAASAIGAESASSSMVGLKSTVSGGTGRVEVECVTTGAWVSLAIPDPRSDFTSSTRLFYMGNGQY